MPVRLPKARGAEIATFGVAGVGAFAPLYFMLPGAEERLATQTARWAPRWERNISYFAPPAQRIAQRAEPHVARTVRKIDDKLPLDKVAQKTDRGIKKGIHHISKFV
ncbi:hypothetical protein F5Y16DRAFT_104969 [Xylariaceae sp. FL0255]|nr:hypothetical protein F5Y16DRAFT_104969 [Xylariaceae sp. FL0255]